MKRLLCLYLINVSLTVSNGFSLTSLFGYEEEEPIVSKRRDLLEEYGEEGLQQRFAEAFGSEEKNVCTGPKYGVDLSFPIHRSAVSDNYDWLPHNLNPSENPAPKKYIDEPIQYLGDKQTFYEKLIDGCKKRYPGRSCEDTERDRVEMNLRQPRSMQNYTDLGFKKIKAPKVLMEMLTTFYESNKHLESHEKWNVGNTYTNHWDAPTYMLSVENEQIPGGGYRLKEKIWDAARETMQEWTGESLTPCSLYGIRIYKEGAVLAPHVDRLPLVSSAIINVAQDVDEEWPIEVYAHDGYAYNITMEPGDMVLYESHSVIHGRPFPLKGRYYANVFIHFEPNGHSRRHNSGGQNAEKNYEQAKKRELEETEVPDLPPYILKGTEEERRWRQKQGQERVAKKVDDSSLMDAHRAAATGHLGRLESIAKNDDKALFFKDKNGWMPFHEAARAGQTKVLKYLLEKGTPIDERTNDGKGGNALWLAINYTGKDHEAVQFLKEKGAKNIGPA